MRVFVAGATGALGRRLVPMLLGAGHEVTGMTRSESKAGALRDAGAEAAVCDALDSAAVRRAVEAASPEIVISELTDLPRAYDPRNVDYGPTNRLRTEGTRALLEAALAAGARRIVVQSVAFLYAPEGGSLKREDDRPFLDAPPPFDTGVAAAVEQDEMVTGAAGIEGIVLRYGWFYGPGTYYAPDGAIAQQVRRRRFPVVGRGTGTFSFIHVDDAAAATVAALDRGRPGIYNVVDDDPAPLRDWVPAFAEAIGAKRPFRVPTLLARLVAGPLAVMMARDLRGASNGRARRELGWEPRYPSWREGFREALG